MVRYSNALDRTEIESDKTGQSGFWMLTVDHSTVSQVRFLNVDCTFFLLYVKCLTSGVKFVVGFLVVSDHLLNVKNFLH
jgi:hypothetical protein